ncbi:NADH-quinone oxidoreductase subunit G [Nakamurella deserti]|uniref:NADH-quinone oxidoreductase subunit G n=1 Tax=Nakamurella deserti TaxID=2164074 RepID=UPI000DBE076E
MDTNTANAPDSRAGERPAKTPVPEGHVTVTVDGVEVVAPKGELVIRTAERIGIAIPRFCDHPLLAPVGACRQCLVEVEMGGRPMPKPQASCTQEVADGMVVKTQISSPVAEKAQRSNLEFLLLNHPLDCPVCDKGGECPLQNQVLANGAAESRLLDAKRTFTKPIAISTQVLLDRERCVLCQRCTRFSDQIAGDRFIDLIERGSSQQIGISPDQPFQSYFSGNTIQICPVGALTSAAYRFRSRPFDLVSTPGTCEHCASGCSLRVDHRRGQVMRRMAAANPDVNEEWNCDKGRFGFTYVAAPDRLTRPLARNDAGELVEVSWTAAMAAAAEGLSKARDRGGVGVLTGGRLTVTDAYAYAKFARLALRTNDIDFRTRAGSAEEDAFLAHHVAGVGPDGGGVSYADVERAATVVLVGLEPEEESPILFLRLRKAFRRSRTSVFAVAAVASRGLGKVGGTLVPAAPGDEPRVVQELTDPGGALAGRVAGDTVVLVGERAADVPGLLSAVSELVQRTGSRVAWVPRRAGDRGAVDAGALGALLPGGRPVADDAARAEVENLWRASLPTEPGRTTAQILAAAHHGVLGGLLIGGVSIDDLPDPEAARDAIAAAGFVVSLELRHTAVTALADVVFPVAASVEKSGGYLDWEGRLGSFDATVAGKGMLDDGRILDTLGVEMDVDLYTQTPRAAAGELRRLGSRAGSAPAPLGSPSRTGSPAGLRLATWRTAIDGGALLDGEPHLAGTARPDLARLSAATADRLGLADGAEITVRGGRGAVTLPLAVSEMVDDVVWLPGRPGGLPLAGVLGAQHGDPVEISVPAPSPRSQGRTT